MTEKRQPGGGRKPSPHNTTRQWFAFRDDGERAIVMELTTRQRAVAIMEYQKRTEFIAPEQDEEISPALVRLSYESDEELAHILALSRAERTDACVQYYLDYEER